MGRVVGWLPSDYRLSLLGDLALLLGGSEDSFTGQLLLLIVKADPGNRARLRQAFPLEVRAWEIWMSLAEPTAQDVRDQLAAEPPQLY